MPTPQQIHEAAESADDMNLREKTHANTTNHLLHQLISCDYAVGSVSEDFDDCIGKFFDELLWAQKHNPPLLYELLEMKALQQINTRFLREQHQGNNDALLKNYIILMTNCTRQGLLAEIILDQKLPHEVLQLFIHNKCNPLKEGEEIVEYVGSFLKAYNYLFVPEWLAKFCISEQGEEYFELFELCLKYYNCPEPITRNSVMKIVLSLLSYRQVRQYLHGNKNQLSSFKNIATEMSKQFRIELAAICLRLNHMSQSDDVESILSELEDKIVWWEDLSTGVSDQPADLQPPNPSLCQSVFQMPFFKHVLLPLLLGPLDSSHHPLFTLKFSLYVLTKLLNVVRSLGLLQIVFETMFVEQDAKFWPQTMCKTVLCPFKLEILTKLKLPSLNDEPTDSHSKTSHTQETEQCETAGNKLKIFYTSILKSKDNHFLLMSTVLIGKLFAAYSSSKIASVGCSTEMLLLQFNEILICQLQEIHCLNTVISIIDALVIINHHRPITENSCSNMLIYLVQKLLADLKQVLGRCPEENSMPPSHIDGLLQSVEYDIRTIQSLKLGSEVNGKKYEDLYRVVFYWDIGQEQKEMQSFYSAVPDTNQEHLRYLFVKFLILRRGSEVLLVLENQLGPKPAEGTDLLEKEEESEPHPNIEHPTGKIQKPLTEQYYTRFISVSPYMGGDLFLISSIKAQIFPCELVDGKTRIPIVLIRDNDFFVLGHQLGNQSRIIMSIKYKHVSIVPHAKKQSIKIEVHIHAYNSSSQRMQQKQPFVIKRGGSLVPVITASQHLQACRGLIFIKELLEGTERVMPSINLV